MAVPLLCRWLLLLLLHLLPLAVRAWLLRTLPPVQQRDLLGERLLDGRGGRRRVACCRQRVRCRAFVRRQHLAHRTASDSPSGGGRTQARPASDRRRHTTHCTASDGPPGSLSGGWRLATDGDRQHSHLRPSRAAQSCCGLEPRQARNVWLANATFSISGPPWITTKHVVVWHGCTRLDDAAGHHTQHLAGLLWQLQHRHLHRQHLQGMNPRYDIPPRSPQRSRTLASLVSAGTETSKHDRKETVAYRFLF